MLILNIINEDVKKRKKFKDYFTKNKDDFEEKNNSFICGKVVFNIINVRKKAVLSGEFDKYFAHFKGKILKTKDEEINDYLKDYLCDLSDYYKKSYLSELKKIISKENDISLCIYDDKFECSDELYNLARYCKNITVYTPHRKEADKYKFHCYEKFGINIFVNESFALGDGTVYLNLNNVYKDKAIFINIKGKEQVLMLDYNYFLRNDDVDKLIPYGIPLKTACAVFKCIS